MVIYKTRYLYGGPEDYYGSGNNNSELSVSKLVLVTGGRYWNNEEIIRDILIKMPGRLEVIHGACKRWDKDKRIYTCADYQAETVCLDLCIPVTGYPANWDRYGKGAGRIRNIFMLDLNPNVVLAFHNNLEESKGTKHCAMEAVRRRIPTMLVSESGDEDW